MQYRALSVSINSRTYSFSKFQKRHAREQYNWVRFHKSLRVTPAMAAGLSETVTDWTEIVEAMDADAPAQKRGPYKKTGDENSN